MRCGTLERQQGIKPRSIMICRPALADEGNGGVVNNGGRRPSSVWWSIMSLIAAAAIIAVVVAQRDGGVREVPYSQFERWLDEGRIASVRVGETVIRGELRKEPDGDTQRFVTIRVDPALADRFKTAGTETEGAPPPGLLETLISWMAPALLIYLALFVIMPRVGGGVASYLSIGKSRARLYGEKEISTTFADVAGVDEAKAELAEIVAFLKDPEAFGRLGARAPKGVLLIGAPGTGKTLLARAVAGEAGVPFFSISGSEFVEMFVGVGAARVRDLFDQARAKAPAIIFIDELDALGRSRANALISGYDEKEQTLNQLLSEIDGFDPSAGVILLAATNRPEILDRALLRAGRFDRQVLVDLPDRGGRRDILAVHCRRITIDPSCDLDEIAALTPGFAGADLANLANEAAIIATRRKASAVALSDFESAIERIVAGIEKRSRILSARERRRVAVHEMGHAIVASRLASADPVQKVSIIPRGVGALGYTLQRPSEDRFVFSLSELSEKLTVLMGGRAAETLVFGGDVSTGAADDLEEATQIALDMVERYGMDAAVGSRTFLSAFDPYQPGARMAPDASETTRHEIDLAVRSLLGSALGRALSILTEHRSGLEEGVRLLLDRETITPDTFPLLKKCAPGEGGGQTPEVSVEVAAGPV
jgi:cell division protease FtsH